VKWQCWLLWLSGYGPGSNRAGGPGPCWVVARGATMLIVAPLCGGKFGRVQEKWKCTHVPFQAQALCLTWRTKRCHCSAQLPPCAFFLLPPCLFFVFFSSSSSSPFPFLSVLVLGFDALCAQPPNIKEMSNVGVVGYQGPCHWLWEAPACHVRGDASKGMLHGR